MRSLYSDICLEACLVMCIAGKSFPSFPVDQAVDGGRAWTGPDQTRPVPQPEGRSSMIHTQQFRLSSDLSIPPSGSRYGRPERIWSAAPEFFLKKAC
jgi:hypothetical protein